MGWVIKKDFSSYYVVVNPFSDTLKLYRLFCSIWTAPLWMRFSKSISFHRLSKFATYWGLFCPNWYLKLCQLDWNDANDWYIALCFITFNFVGKITSIYIFSRKNYLMNYVQGEDHSLKIAYISIEKSHLEMLFMSDIFSCLITIYLWEEIFKMIIHSS